jgi:hypothetical protein
MGVTSWKIVERAEVQTGDVTISEQLWPTLKVKQTDKVKVSVKGGKTQYLSALKREAAEGADLFVKPGTFKIAEGTTPAVTVKKVSAFAAGAHLILKTRDGILSLAGLVLAIAGTIAQAINSSRANPSTVWIVIASVAQVLGLLLVFFRGVANLTPS